jgi:hypothetical protein
MSHEQWAVCPQCHRTHIEGVKERKKRLRQAYGKIELAQFIEEIEKIRTQEQLAANQIKQMRETYSIGITGDQLRIDYSASCINCAFTTTFTHVQSVLEQLKRDNEAAATDE